MGYKFVVWYGNISVVVSFKSVAVSDEDEPGSGRSRAGDVYFTYCGDLTWEFCPFVLHGKDVFGGFAGHEWYCLETI